VDEDRLHASGGRGSQRRADSRQRFAGGSRGQCSGVLRSGIRATDVQRDWSRYDGTRPGGDTRSSGGNTRRSGVDNPGGDNPGSGADRNGKQQLPEPLCPGNRVDRRCQAISQSRETGDCCIRYGLGEKG